MTNEQLADTIMSSISSDKFGREDLLALLQKAHEERESSHEHKFESEKLEELAREAALKWHGMEFNSRERPSLATIILSPLQEVNEELTDQIDYYKSHYEAALDNWNICLARIAELEQENQKLKQ